MLLMIGSHKMTRIYSEKTTKRLQLAEDYTKAISAYNRRRNKLKEALLANGVKPQALTSASTAWMEQKVEELGIPVEA